jgi:hypothetical protein
VQVSAKGPQAAIPRLLLSLPGWLPWVLMRSGDDLSWVGLSAATTGGWFTPELGFSWLLRHLAVRPPRQNGLGSFRSLLQIGILFLPLFYLPLAVTSELSTEAAEKRSLYTPRVAASRPESPRPAMSDPKPKNQIESAKLPKNPAKSPEPTMLELLSDPEDFEGSNGLVGSSRDKSPANASTVIDSSWSAAGRPLPASLWNGPRATN